MKKISRAIIAVFALLLCFAPVSCGDRYVSKYSAMLMKRTHTSDMASVSFDTFCGTYVMKFRISNDEQVLIAYRATLEEGNINVFYDYNDEKVDLFEVHSDGATEGKTQAIAGNTTLYIVIESNDTCRKGSFSFVLERSEA